MRKLSVASVCVLSGAAFLTVSDASADGPPAPKPTITVQPLQPVPAAPITPKAPIDLGPRKKDVFNGALGKAGLPPLQLPPPPAYVKLTPVALVGAGGARIAKVGRAFYYGASVERPDGAFLLDPPAAFTPPSIGGLAPPLQPSGKVELEVSVEGSKLYMVDCRLGGGPSPIPGLPSGPGKPVTFGRSSTSATQSVSPDDGHYMYPFRTDASVAPTTLTVTLTIAAGNEQQYFYGCEITKL